MSDPKSSVGKTGSVRSPRISISAVGEGAPRPALEGPPLLAAQVEHRAALLDEILSASPDHIYLYDRAGRLQYANLAGANALGVDRRTVVGKTWRELGFSPDTMDPLEAQVQAVFSTGQARGEEAPFPTAAGIEYRDCLLRPILGEDGAVQAVVSIVRDITERQRAEEALRESERRYRTLFGQLEEAFAVHEILCDESGNPRDYRFLEVNPAFERMTGLKREEILGKTVLQVLPDLEKYWIDTYGEVALTGKTVRFENYSGSLERYYEVIAFCPKKGQFATLFVDVTALHRLQEQLARRADELQSILDNMVDAVFVSDAEGRITLTNEAGVRLLGLAGEDEVKRVLPDVPNLLRVRHQDGRPLASGEQPLMRALAGATVTQMAEIIHNPRTQQDAFLRTNAVPIRDENGKIVGAVAVARDVTELAELDRLKDQFIAVAAHELKTPVAIMKGYAQAILRQTEDLSAQRRKMLESIDRGADRIDRIVRDLLDVSRLHLGQLDLSEERIDLPQMVEELVDRMALTAAKHRLRVASADPAVVQGDRDRLEQVVVNLIDNALRYSPRAGDVEVRVAVVDREAVVSVRDHGAGIPESKRSRLFQRFYRAHTDTPYDYGGMGVGLYISREIVARHGGRMWFESEEGTGSTFYFSLPLRGEQGGSKRQEDPGD